MSEIQPTELFKAMLRIRRVEEALAERYAEQQMRCPMHLCIGQEAIAVGVCAALRKDDKVFGNHRAHGHYLAKGGNLNAMVAELYGRTTGCCGGRGGSMHLIDIPAGFMGSTPIVGGTVPLAVGSAWNALLTGSGQVTAVFFGDGCFEEGVVHESMNFAVLHCLPIVFICENNDFSVFTPLQERQPDRPIFRLAEAHGMSAFYGNGNDIEEVVRISQTMIVNARNGLGPQFAEFRTYRWREHCGPNYDDDLNYRSQSEITAGRDSCPVANYQAFLERIRPEFARELACFEAEICVEIANAFEYALNSAKPSIDHAGKNVYA